MYPSESGACLKMEVLGQLWLTGGCCQTPLCGPSSSAPRGCLGLHDPSSADGWLPMCEGSAEELASLGVYLRFSPDLMLSRLLVWEPVCLEALLRLSSVE